MAKSQEQIHFLAARIKRYRKQNGYTQQQVADYLDIQRPTYAYKETGKTDISIDLLKKLAALYHVNLDELVGTADAQADGLASSSLTETNQGREIRELIQRMDAGSREALLAFLRVQADKDKNR